MSHERPTRRDMLRLLGGVAGAGLLPWNFACDAMGRHVVVGSSYIPTPDAPLTPTEDFYVNANFGIPGDIRSPARWRLHLDGLVGHARTLTLDDLLALPQVERELTLECIGNKPGGDLISSGAFTGARLADVLALAGGVSGRARGLYFMGLDGYPSLQSVSLVDRAEVMLVHTLNGAPLGPDHGAPVRLLVPGHYGMYSVKWLDSITATREFGTFGALAGLTTAVVGPTSTTSHIDVPAARLAVDRGEVTVSGLAVTAGLGVARVEVRDTTADGRWTPAEITFDPIAAGRGPWLWSLWRATLTMSEPGDHVLEVRAFDLAGGGQSHDPEFPYDASAIHRVRVHVRAS